jgi:hypothetical protein
VGGFQYVQVSATLTASSPRVIQANMVVSGQSITLPNVVTGKEFVILNTGGTQLFIKNSNGSNLLNLAANTGAFVFGRSDNLWFVKSF